MFLSVKWGWQLPPFGLLFKLDDLTQFKCLEVVLVIHLGEGDIMFFLWHSGKPPSFAFNIDAGSALLPGYHYELPCLSRPETPSWVESQTDTQEGVPQWQKTVCCGTISKRRKHLTQGLCKVPWKKSHAWIIRRRGQLNGLSSFQIGYFMPMLGFELHLKIRGEGPGRWFSW